MKRIFMYIVAVVILIGALIVILQMTSGVRNFLDIMWNFIVAMFYTIAPAIEEI